MRPPGFEMRWASVSPWLRSRHWVIKLLIIYGVTAAIVFPAVAWIETFMAWGDWTKRYYVPVLMAYLLIALGVPSLVGALLGFRAIVGPIAVIAASLGWVLLVDAARLIFGS